MDPTDDEKYHRQQDIIDMEELFDLSVSVIGGGAIGSMTCFLLSKMGVQDLQVWDADDIEEHNLSNQFFPQSALKENKAEAIADIIERWEGTEIDARPEMFYDQIGELGEITVFAVDSIEARTEIWQEIYQSFETDFLIDARMGAEAGEIHAVDTITPSHQEHYEQTLHDPEDDSELPCTARTTIYCGSVMANYICSYVKKYNEGEEIPQTKHIDMHNIEII